MCYRVTVSSSVDLFKLNPGDVIVGLTDRPITVVSVQRGWFGSHDLTYVVNDETHTVRIYKLPDSARVIKSSW